jgi:hypothetical protein
VPCGLCTWTGRAARASTPRLTLGAGGARWWCSPSRPDDGGTGPSRGPRPRPNLIAPGRVRGGPHHSRPAGVPPRCGYQRRGLRATEESLGARDPVWHSRTQDEMCVPRPLMSAIGVGMARRGLRPPARRARPRRGSRGRLGPSAKDLVIVSRALVDLAEFLRTPQESTGRGRVVLDRRVAERRAAAVAVDQDRRRTDRRQPPPSAEALMQVLGFMVVPAGKPPGEPVKRRSAERSRRAHPRGRAARGVRRHRGRRA